MHRLHALFSLTLAFPPGVAASRIEQEPFDSLRAYIQRTMSERQIPSVALAAAKGGRIVFEEGFGWANKERQVRATPATMYSLASISKPITATGLMVLIQRGKVDLDRPVEQFLSGIKLTAHEGRSADATVRLVANHTAGLPLHYQFFYVNGTATRPSMAEAIGRYGILAAPPGAQFTYSNLGYGILEEVIERTSRTPFERFMAKEVFRPLGLPRMAIVTGPVTGDSVAERYDARGTPIPWYDFDHRGASAVYSSAHDLVRFGMFHLGNRLADQKAVLSPASLEQMHRATSRRSEKVGYGIGWQTFEDDYGFTSLGHSGGMPGVATVLRIYPEADAAVVVLTNSGVGEAASRIAAHVAALVLPTRFADRLREVESRPAETPPSRFTPPAELVGEWAGTVRTWNGSLPMTLAIAADGSTQASIADQPKAAVVNPRLQGGRLSGNFDGTIPTPDANREPGNIVLDLRFHDDRLSGAVSRAAPNGYALSSYVSLTRQRTP